MQVLTNPLETSRFGEVTAYQPYTFARPLLGFEQYTKLALLPQLSGFPEESPMVWLQSMENPELAFILTQPPLFGLPYTLTLPDDCLQALGLSPQTASATDVAIYTLVTWQNEMTPPTTNLLAPLIFAPATGQAVQWVLNSPHLSTKAPLVQGEAP
jgi:flagellar assembly factor FliW